MATKDSGIKNATVAYKNLPLTTADGRYLFKFRILSQDGVNSSEWSTIQSITMPNLTTLFASSITNTTTKSGTTLTSSWTVPINPTFDIFYRYAATAGAVSSATYVYYATVDAKNISISLPAAYGQIYVQAAVSPKILGTVTKIFESAIV
jgi:hypothetical protein